MERDSSEYRIGAPFGVVKATTRKTLPITHGLRADVIQNLVGYHWAPYGKGDGKAFSAPAITDARQLEKAEVPGGDEQDEGEAPDEGVSIELQRRGESRVRKFHIRDTGFILHGSTDGCRGCRAIETGLQPVGHNAACHDRVAVLLKHGSESDMRRIKKAESRMAQAAGNDIRRIVQLTKEQVEQAVKQIVDGSRAALAT